MTFVWVRRPGELNPWIHLHFTATAASIYRSVEEKPLVDPVVFMHSGRPVHACMHYSSKPLHGSADPRKHTSLFFLCVQRCQSYDAMHHACMHAGVASTYATTFAGWRFNEPFAVKHTLLGASCRVCSWFLLSASYFQVRTGVYLHVNFTLVYSARTTVSSSSKYNE